MSARTLAFHFDFLSPYAYLAWCRVHVLAEPYGVAVRPVPTLLAALLADGGMKGPAEVPKKRAYLYKNAYRLAQGLGVPFGLPPAHPFRPVLALRLAGLDMPEDERRRVIDALFAGSWGGGGVALDDRDAVRECLDRASLNGGALVERAETDEAKARLREVTQAALDAGIFGVPTLVVDGEVFWGFDAFEHVKAALEGRDPFAHGGVDATPWERLGATARRS
jgi:2-hydroxychromene-2-carboxylate isomerase